MTTDLAEAGLERLICEALTGDPCEPASGGTVGEPSPGYGGGGWSPGNRHDYDREYCVDLCQLRTFLHATQPESAALCIGETVRNSTPRPWGPPRWRRRKWRRSGREQPQGRLWELFWASIGLDPLFGASRTHQKTISTSDCGKNNSRRNQDSCHGLLKGPNFNSPD